MIEDVKMLRKLLISNTKHFLVKESSDYTIDSEVIKCFELVNDQKVEYCEIIEDQKVESCELIEDHDAK